MPVELLLVWQSSYQLNTSKRPRYDLKHGGIGLSFVEHQGGQRWQFVLSNQNDLDNYEKKSSEVYHNGLAILSWRVRTGGSKLKCNSKK